MSAPFINDMRLNLTDLEMNVLQVAIDHMVEHLEDLPSDSDWKTELVNQERLEAAKRLKERFA